MNETHKEYVRADTLVRDSFVLAKQIYDSNFIPEVLLVLWRGGTPVGIVVHEFLQYKGIETYHAAIKAISYTGIEQRVVPRIEHLDAVLPSIKPGARVLIIDDIFDTGRTIEATCRLLRPRTQNVRVATLYYKVGTNQTELEPDFYVRQTTDWIVFPHELMDLTPDELETKDPVIRRLVAAPRGEPGEP